MSNTNSSLLSPIYVCEVCNRSLEWGEFAYKQEICWDCFAQTTRDILRSIKTYYPIGKVGDDTITKHTEHINYIMAIVAEVFGYEW